MALTKTQRRALLLLRHRIQLKTCILRFDPGARQVIAERRSMSMMEDDTEEIREAMRLYRQTWIEPLLDALLNHDTRILQQLLESESDCVKQLEEEDSCDD